MGKSYRSNNEYSKKWANKRRNAGRKNRKGNFGDSKNKLTNVELGYSVGSEVEQY